MTNGFMKLVDFEMCKTCKNKNTSEKEKPCDDCMAVPAREDTCFPLY